MKKIGGFTVGLVDIKLPSAWKGGLAVSVSHEYQIGLPFYFLR